MYWLNNAKESGTGFVYVGPSYKVTAAQLGARWILSLIHISASGIGGRGGGGESARSRNRCVRRGAREGFRAVSYTHLDVYKRQAFARLPRSDVSSENEIEMVGLPDRLDVYKRQLYVFAGGA